MTASLPGRAGRGGNDDDQHGAAAHRRRASELLTGAGLTGTVLLAGRSRLAAASGIALPTGRALQRFGAFSAGVESTKDPRYTVVQQRERLDAAARGPPVGTASAAWRAAGPGWAAREPLPWRRLFVPPGRKLVEVAVLADAARAPTGLLDVLSAAAAPSPAAGRPGGDRSHLCRRGLSRVLHLEVEVAVPDHDAHPLAAAHPAVEQ
jgi:hypothetical protein